MRLSPQLGLLVAAATLSAPALAEDGFSYNYLEAAYIDTQIDDGDLDVDGDGIGVAGSVELGESFFLEASYGRQEFDFDVDLDQWTVGLGAHAPLSDAIDLVGRVGYVDAEIDTDFGSIDDDGYLAGIGLRGRVADNFELEGGVNYVDLGDGGDATTFEFGGRLYLSPNFAIGAGVELDDDVTTWNAGVRFEF